MRLVVLVGLVLAGMCWSLLAVAADSKAAAPATSSAADNDQAKSSSKLLPKVVVTETSFNFGVVKGDETVAHDFIVENKGEGTLLIKQVSPGWGCTVVKFDREIAPGEKGKIKLSVHVYPEWAGQKFNKRALVVTNDLKKERFILDLNGEVEGASKRPANASFPDNQGS